MHRAPAASRAEGPLAQSGKGKSKFRGEARSVAGHRAYTVENDASGVGGDEGAFPLPVSRSGVRQGGDRRVRMMEEEVIGDGEQGHSSPGSPDERCSTRQGSRRRDSGSATKRKRDAEEDGEHEPLRPLQRRELRGDGDRDDARNAEALAELTTARARYRAWLDPMLFGLIVLQCGPR